MEQRGNERGTDYLRDELADPAAADFGPAEPPPILPEALARHARLQPEAAALVAPGRVLSYRDLAQLVAEIGATWRSCGVGRTGRIGIALPSGPEAAVLNITAACHAIAVPLDPEAAPPEFEERAMALRLDAVVLAEASHLAATAERCGLAVFDMAPGGGCRMSLTAGPLRSPLAAAAAKAGDLALILSTSGTTARPKVVPLTHGNLAASTAKMWRWFGVSAADRALILLPLRYAHGVRSSVFTPVLCGASIACPAGSPTDEGFLEVLRDLAPTWYSAGPAHLRRILEIKRAQPGMPHRLRFILSGGGALPEAVRCAVAEAFGVPVLDGYGLSEAGLFLSNALPPGRNKPGTLGFAPPDAVRLAPVPAVPPSDAGIGEILLRGPDVIFGYLDDDVVNRAAFDADGWFRTGDLGTIDADGFLTIVGRLKEQINRGGEKISPAEIDRALLRHPAVVEAAAFGVPHPRLGEDVAAAVVLRPGCPTQPAELRRFLRDAMAPSKVPHRILIVDELPKGETGKVQRARLPELLHAATAGPPAAGDDPPGSPLEAQLAALWRRLLDAEIVGRDDDFFERGGDSLLATEMLLEVERLTGRTLPATALFEAPTIRELAGLLGAPAGPDDRRLIALQTGGSAPPFFFFPDELRERSGRYVRQLARLLGPEQPFVVVPPIGSGGKPFLPPIEIMAARHADALVAEHPHGSFRLGGFCSGALVAFAVARQLSARGREVELVALIDPPIFGINRVRRLLYACLSGAFLLIVAEGSRLDRRIGAAIAAAQRHGARRMFSVLRPAPHRASGRPPGGPADGPPVRRIDRQWRRAVQAHIPRPAPVPVMFFAAENAGEPWRGLATGVDIVRLDCDHLGCVTTHLDEIGTSLRARFERREDRSPVASA